jgi:hypothetical protein
MADRCDVYGTRGHTRFTPIAVQMGTVLVMGDACHECREILGFEKEESA